MEGKRHTVENEKVVQLGTKTSTQLGREKKTKFGKGNK